MSIPKIIHYCWFGEKPLPILAEKCIESWKKYLPEYKLVLWNEESFDIDSHPFTRQAYISKKYAFITDYVRLYALFNFGGVYMDTDVEVLKNFDAFLKYKAFSGFENETVIPTGIMAATKGHATVEKLLAYYNEKSFISKDGTLRMTPNTQIISEILENEGFKRNGEYQVLNNDFHIFPRDYFCPHDYYTGLQYFSSNTFTIHHFSGSWLPKRKRITIKLKYLLIKMFGVNFVNKIKKIV